MHILRFLRTRAMTDMHVRSARVPEFPFIIIIIIIIIYYYYYYYYYYGFPVAVGFY